MVTSSSSGAAAGFIGSGGLERGLGTVSRNTKNVVLLSLGLLVLACSFVQVRSEAYYEPSRFVKPRALLSTPWLSCITNAGICQDPTKNPYPAATTCCGKRVCRDLQTDPANCGSCGRICPFGNACCRGKCVNIQTNQQNCGKCNYSCPGITVCSFGMCGYAGNGISG